MKQNIVRFFIATLVTAPAISFAADDVPKPESFARYEPMMKRSPFAVATAVALPAATPNFAKDLYIANAARTANGDLVTIASSSDKSFKEYLSTKETVDGYSVPSIEWSDRVGETKVTISKDGQFATLTFNQALLAQAPAGAPPQPVVPPQPIPQQPNMGVPPPHVPSFGSVQQQPPQPYPNQIRSQPQTIPTPPPRVRGVIQRKPVPNGFQQPAASSADEKKIEPDSE
jgi:hypothetical protein